MTSKFSIDNRDLLQRISSGEAVVGIDFGNLIVRELARMALAAMGSEPHTDDELSNLLWYSQEATCHSDPNYYCEFQRLATPGLIAGIIRELQERRKAAMDSESGYLPLDYLQGHKDGLEWAAQLAEANHPETGDWLYDDPIELAKAIRKGPDMQPAQPAADSEPVIVVGDDGGDALSYRRLIQSFEPGTKLYRHAQPELVVPELRVDWQENEFSAGWNACRAAMLAAAPHDTPALNSVQSVVTVPGKWIPVSERMPDDDDFVYIWPRPDFGVELHVGQYCECSPKGDGWYAQVYEQNYGIEWHPITVTHWMPLPNPPKEEK